MQVAVEFQYRPWNVGIGPISGARPARGTYLCGIHSNTTIFFFGCKAVNNSDQELKLPQTALTEWKIMTAKLTIR